MIRTSTISFLLFFLVVDDTIRSEFTFSTLTHYLLNTASYPRPLLSPPNRKCPSETLSLSLSHHSCRKLRLDVSVRCLESETMTLQDPKKDTRVCSWCTSSV